jgi:DNA polymerase-3 subunit alpha
MGLFGDDDQPETGSTDLPDVPPWDERERLVKEKEVLGFYLTSHPLAEHEKTLTAYCSHSTVKAAELSHRAEVMLGGMLSAIKLSHTKNPKPGSPSRYAMFDLEDAAGIMRTIVWPDQFVNYEEQIKPDAIVVIRGVIDKRPGSEEANFIVNEIIPLENLAARYTRGVRIRVSEEAHGPHTLEQLHEILRGYPGNCELELTLCLADGSRAACKCDNTRLSVTPEMQARVDQLLGPGNFRLLTSSPGATSGGGGRGNGRGRR